MSKQIHDWKFGVSIISLCVIWYSTSSAASILNKIILQQFPYPLTVSMSSLLGTSLYAIPWMRGHQSSRINLPAGYLLKFIIPLALGKVVAVCLSYFSLWKVPVSYAHTVKASMPLFVVICARIILREKQSCLIYVSLLPIITGVVIASATELSFSVSGMLSALFSTFTYALLNTIVKKILQETGLHHVKLLGIITQIACGTLFPFWFVLDVPHFWSYKENGSSPMTAHILILLFASGIIHFIQNLCSFTLIKQLTALSYAVANATKRITVITTSLLTLKNPVTPVNMFGMLMAVFGVLAYNRAKQMQKATANVTTQESEAMLLPMSMSDASLSEQSLLLQLNSNQTLPFSVHNSPPPTHYPTNETSAFWRRTQSGSSTNGEGADAGAVAGAGGGARFYINGQFEEV